MKRCGLCHRILWPFPWSHIAITGRTQFHVRCYQYLQAYLAQDAEQWEQIARDGGI